MEIHCPSRSDRTPSSFGEVTPSSTIQLLLENDRAFVVRFTIPVGAIRNLYRLGDSVASDPTFTEGRSDFCHQIHRHSRSHRTPSSFGEVTPPSAIQLLLEDDQTFVIRSIALIHNSSRSDRTPSSFGEVTPPSAIQLLLGDDRTFVVRSIALVGAIVSLSFGEVTPPSTIQLLPGDDQAFVVRSTALERSDTFIVWRGDSTVSDLTSTEGRSDFCRQIHRPSRSDRTPSSFGERDKGKTVPSTSSWRSKDRAAPSSFSQGYNILEMSVEEAFGFEYEDTSLKPSILYMEKLQCNPQSWWSIGEVSNLAFE
ncbi:hypothetical protein E5676_scaffold228G00490 [Cucumis melo var. makuwa]|uniref:Uncharacterized protein n=1 Tax=Cucumis melo var. makuwa TaxID=1194695 RepID=A0A5A7TC10_CUCMM|nr:hypothetical protein E6C27_scaffold125G002200 [Cucumis melo var. makuwa]TYK20352.1 hypothetical protein E5676_scaffold228G00490 [Cucumis melo var. makuwa]